MSALKCLLLLVAVCMVLSLLLLFGARQGESTALWLTYVSEQDGGSNVFRMDFYGEQVQRVSNDFGDDFAPTWSPRNDYVAFASYRGTSSAIYLTPPEGGLLIEVALAVGSAIDPHWAPDGSAVIFERHTARGDRSIMYYELATRQLQVLTGAGGRDWSPDWTPDGRHVLFTSNRGDSWQIFSVDVQSETIRQITSGAVSFRNPSIAPDGKAFVVRGDVEGNADIYLLTMQGNIWRRLTTHPALDAFPVWSPDGEHIAFLSERAGGSQLFVVDIQGEQVRQVTKRAVVGEVSGRAHWSDGGQWLAFTGMLDGGTQSAVFRVGVDGSDLQRLTPPGHNSSSPDWSPALDMPLRAARVGLVALLLCGLALLLGWKGAQEDAPN